MIIRKATLQDSKFIAEYLLLAMEEIVYKFIGERDANKALQFMLHLAERENNQYSYKNCWVAEVYNDVIAAVIVYDGAKLSELRQPVIEHIRSTFNREIFPEDETEAGEFYIDSIGVHPEFQGKGIGSKILQFLIDEYVTQRDEVLGLLVDEDNPNAKRLYLKLGFVVIGKKILLGKNLEHMQLKKKSAGFA